MGLGGWPDQARPYSSKQGLEPVRSTRGQQDSVEVRSPQLLGGGGPGHWEGYCRSPGSTMEACRRLRVRTGRWANHLEGRSRGLWDRLEVGPEEKAINVRGDSNLLPERLKGVGAPGTGAMREKRGPCMPNPLSHPSPQDRERSLASLPLQPNNHTGMRLRTSCHTVMTPGPQARRQSKKLTETETGLLPVDSPLIASQDPPFPNPKLPSPLEPHPQPLGSPSPAPQLPSQRQSHCQSLLSL